MYRGPTVMLQEPEHIEPVDELSRNASIKVVKGELRKMYGRSACYEQARLQTPPRGRKSPRSMR